MSEQTIRILVLDDDAIVAESIATYLSGVGFDTPSSRLLT